MRIHVKLTEEIINNCLQLHYHDQAGGRRQKQRLFLIPLLMLGLAGYILWDEYKQPKLGSNFYMALLYISFAFIYYYFMRHRMMRAGGKLLKNLGNNASFEMEVNEHSLTTTTHQTTFSQEWSSFTGGLISDENVLLYQTNHSFSMFNHTFFESTADFAQFKSWVREKVQPVLEK